MAMAPSMEESLDVVKQALQESLMKAEEAIDLTDGEAQEALRRSEQEKEELMQELRYLRAEVSRLQDSGATEASLGRVDQFAREDSSCRDKTF
ncbi:unnamed protein product [Effrenium voratum]|uniref:Uncharacterized protein n=1 Tax=Effrenium voratum TaxID=2562239 RepID=A0AA36MNN0_9DINO|nr:unnamed protein product [Effrenium voratum]